ncbi:hypothetical protein CKA32_003357 [Geitlerinema sp. FC II]|nr:hypothetical protein CKA32_003357 [Geitlerinema sp. FC II]
MKLKIVKFDWVIIQHSKTPQNAVGRVGFRSSIQPISNNF